MLWLLHHWEPTAAIALLRHPQGPCPLVLALAGGMATYGLLRRLGISPTNALPPALVGCSLDGGWLLGLPSAPPTPLEGGGETLELELGLGWGVGLLGLLLPLFLWAQRGPLAGPLLAALLYLAVPLAGDVLTLYLLLEGANMAIYALLAQRWAAERSHPATATLRLEPVVGYFLINLLGSFLLLLGCGCLYLASGTLNFGEMALMLRPSGAGLELIQGGLLPLGVLTLLSGLLLKLGGAPFHFWVAPIYEGLPLPIFVLLQLFAKGGLLLLLLKLGGTLGFGALPGVGRALLLLGALNLLWGTVGALAQTSLRRLLIYSSLANLGPLLYALAVGGEGTSGAGLLYVALYLATTASLLLPLLAAGWEGRWPLVELARGVAPPLRAVVTLAVLNLSGVPPFALFFAKVPVALELAERGFHLSLLLLLVTSVVAVAYAIPLLALLWLQGAPAEGRAPTLAAALSPLPPLLGALLLGLGAARPPLPHPVPWEEWLLPGGTISHGQLQEGILVLVLLLAATVWSLDRAGEGPATAPSTPSTPSRPTEGGRLLGSLLLPEGLVRGLGEGWSVLWSQQGPVALLLALVALGALVRGLGLRWSRSSGLRFGLGWEFRWGWLALGWRLGVWASLWYGAPRPRR